MIPGEIYYFFDGGPPANIPVHSADAVIALGTRLRDCEDPVAMPGETERATNQPIRQAGPGPGPAPVWRDDRTAPVSRRCRSSRVSRICLTACRAATRGNPMVVGAADNSQWTRA